MNAKSLLLTIAIAGLLLGGNIQSAFADGTVSSQDAQTKIQMLKTRINALTAQANQLKNASKTTFIVNKNLTPGQIASIQAQINDIASKIANLKIEVQKFVQIKQIKQKIAALRQLQIAAIKAQIARLNAQIKAKQAATSPASTAASAHIVEVNGVQAVPVAKNNSAKDDKKEIESQIAKVKEQISQITKEMETQKALEKANESQTVSSDSNKCEGQSCSANAQSSDSSKTSESSQQPAKGFWQSVGDFLRKIFSF